MNVIFNKVIAKDGLSPADRFASMTKQEGVFYAVGNELYFKDVLLSTDMASEIGILDSAGNFVADNVEAALAEICTKYPVTVTKTIGGQNDDFVYRYTFYQGGVAIQDGVIDIAKDMVATAGELVHPTPQDPIIIDGQTITDGTYIKMTIANGTPFYINVIDLIEENDFINTDEVTFSVNNHIVSAGIGKVAATKSIYQAQAAAVYTEDTTVDASNFDSKVASGIYTENAGVYTKVQAGATFDANEKYYTLASPAVSEINVKDKIDQVEGDLETLADYVGQIPPESQATDVIGYIDEKTGEGVSSLNGEAGVSTKSVGNVVTIKGGVIEVEGVIKNAPSAAFATTVDGYYNDLDGKFYEENTYTTEIPGVDNETFVDLETGTQYNWTGKMFVKVVPDVVLEEVAVTGLAQDVAINDVGNHFTATNVEGALQEVASQLVWAEV